MTDALQKVATAPSWGMVMTPGRIILSQHKQIVVTIMSQEQNPQFAAVAIRGGMDVRLLFEKGRKSGILVAKSFPTQPDVVHLFNDVIVVVGSTSRSTIRGHMYDCTTKRDAEHGLMFHFSPTDHKEVETLWAPTPTKALRHALVEVASKVDGLTGDDLLKFKKQTAVLDGRMHSCFFSKLYGKVVREMYPEAAEQAEPDSAIKIKAMVKRAPPKTEEGGAPKVKRAKKTPKTEEGVVSVSAEVVS